MKMMIYWILSENISHPEELTMGIAISKHEKGQKQI